MVQIYGGEMFIRLTLIILLNFKYVSLSAFFLSFYKY